MARFYSFVVPAHNEEAIIEETLMHLVHLDYPKDRYEVIVVENGSSDRTFELARHFASAQFKILSTPARGVSHARNLGARHASPRAEWLLFLDADTFLPPAFLKKLDTYLDAHPNKSYGTTKILTDRPTPTSRLFYAYTNISDWLIRVLHRIHIVRRDLAERVRYDESLHSTEDLKYGRELSKYGSYFFDWNNPVISSARRFEKLGYLKMFWLNIWRGILPTRTLQSRDWDIIR